MLIVVLASRTASPPRCWLALVVLLGLSGHDLRRWSLDHRGYLLTQVVAARNEPEALARLLARRPDLAGQLPAAGGRAMKVAVVDYGSGNLASASRALALAAERAGHRRRGAR